MNILTNLGYQNTLNIGNSYIYMYINDKNVYKHGYAVT